ncbi:hypothetical protein GOBAR_AA35179 [Gossypium barbadense]|uniref:EF-hand domain-containing protein n=1 Tax=Gossypium barbadense TaxID=3634 RepID=A0A2P5W344_GOSBA|nr:hypothetical protein GOBAR_AA35179 [Gossypium barbadense]
MKHPQEHGVSTTSTILRNLNGDGRLSKQELKSALYYMGSHFPSWRAAQALNRADGNDDGYISEGEMDDLVEYVWQCGYTVS